MKINKKFFAITLVIAIVALPFCHRLIGLATPVLETAKELWLISDEINWLNEKASRSAPGYGWSPEDIARYKELQQKRQEIYDSEMGWFATAERWTRAGILLLALISYPLCIGEVFGIGFLLYHSIKKKKQ